MLQYYNNDVVINSDNNNLETLPVMLQQYHNNHDYKNVHSRLDEFSTIT